MLAGLGSDYAPRVDRVRKTKRLFFVEGSSDVALLRVFAEKLGIAWPDVWVEWRTAAPHKERAHIFRALREEIPDIVGLSLVDRDDGPVAGVGASLQDTGMTEVLGLVFRKWRRRHIESYLIWPPAIAAASGIAVDEVERRLRDDFAVAISQDNFIRSDAPDPILDLRGKAILKEGDEAILGQLNATAVDVARAMEFGGRPGGHPASPRRTGAVPESFGPVWPSAVRFDRDACLSLPAARRPREAAGRKPVHDDDGDRAGLKGHS